jgi:hypothetical protein
MSASFSAAPSNSSSKVRKELLRYAGTTARAPGAIAGRCLRRVIAMTALR